MAASWPATGSARPAFTAIPSRTTIDQLGNCWVGNRRTGTVVKVGLLENGQWVDRNQNGVVDTSRDTDDDGVIPARNCWTGGRIDRGLLGTGVRPRQGGRLGARAYTGGYANDDWNPGPRSVAVDATGNLWVGSWGCEEVPLPLRRPPA